MKTLILCGGQGTRIRGVADNIPKPMVEIGGRPLIWHIMKIYSHYGFNDFVLLLGYRGASIKEYFLNYRAVECDVSVALGSGNQEYLTTHDEDDWNVVLANTGLDAMTGARVQRGVKYTGNEPFLLTYGDGVADVDINALVDFHRSHGRLATVTGVRPPGRFGELSTDEHGKVTQFEEKPTTTGTINGGFFVIEPAFVERYLTNDETLSLERQPMSKAAKDGELVVFRHDGFWRPVDTYRDWIWLNEAWKNGNAKWKIWK